MTKPAFDSLMNQLAQAGLGATYIRGMMPDWVSRAAVETETGLVELKLLLARRFGLNTESLLMEPPRVEFILPASPRFKRSIRLSDQNLTATASIAVAVTRILVTAMARPYVAPGSPADIRKFVFSHGGKWVSLRGLLKYCLYHGIPVIPLRQLPDGMPKMDGMVVKLDDYPAIVIAKSTPYKAWYSFILAHELGHIYRGDIRDNEILIDDDFQIVLSGAKGKDEDEIAADEFAMEILSGDAKTTAPNLDLTQKPPELARAAMELGSRTQTDPGHLLLRLAYATGEWQRAIAALQVIDRNTEAYQDLSDCLSWSWDPELLSAENTEFLLKVSGTGPFAGIDDDRPG